MLVLGFNGSFDLVNERRYGSDGWHDASAVLIEDGNVVFGIEEERLDRIKHSDKMPVKAIRACLASLNIRLNDLDMICYYSDDFDSMRKDDFLNNPQEPALLLDPATFLRERLRAGLGETVDTGKFRFVHHHSAHAASAFVVSGFKTSLVITLDAEGDELSGIVLDARGNEYKRVDTLSTDNSLGHFYKNVIKYLGYNLFDEYKVMGLAPYGNPERFRGVFRTFYSLLSDGRYEIHDRRSLYPLFDILVPRRTGEPFSQEHKDVAAALQESLEEIAFHIIKHYKGVTGQKNLCLAGGVAHNCTLNGKLLRSGLFENVFVQPAAHDAGCALGAALFAYYEAMPAAKAPSRLDNVYWGADIGDDDSTLRELVKWSGFLEFNREENIVERTAELLAGDQVIGWVQGRSEFGPRALGNRSILADPRPAANKDRINQLVKKREGYRPFAPSVIEEEAETFFDVRVEREQLGFMVYVVDVKKDKRDLLGAVTHVDGTARIQTVSRRTNARFWALIRAFGERTGVPILLNTSFNNNVEPIIDSTEDAIVCFLTTGLDYLIVGNHLIRKREISWEEYLSLSISLPPYVSLHRVKETSPEGGLADTVHLGVSFDMPNNSIVRYEVSNEIAECLSLASGKRTVREILLEAGLMNVEEARGVVSDLIGLWSRRLITLRPQEHGVEGMMNEADCVDRDQPIAPEGETEVWSIGIYTGETLFDLAAAQGVENPVITAQEVTDVRADFVADPFMIRAQGNWHMFFEVWNLDTDKGEIGAAISANGLNWRYQQIVLSEPFHLSYPYVFSMDGGYYMIPETIKAKSVRLYRGDPFPIRWSLVGSILDGSWADPSIFFYDGRWWMFACPASPKNDALHLFYADSISGPWRPHAMNPIVEADNRKARPGGRVVVVGGKVTRFTQDCHPYYGTQVRAFEISGLTTTAYTEQEVDQSPVLSGGEQTWNRSGMHNIDPHWVDDRWLACVDGWRFEKVRSN